MNFTLRFLIAFIENKSQKLATQCFALLNFTLKVFSQLIVVSDV